MRLPLILLFISLACVSGSILGGGPDVTLPLFVSGLSAIAALVLVAKAALLTRRGAPIEPQSLRQSSGGHVVIDGSNVMHWTDGVPRLSALREVVIKLRAEGFQPGLIFDANAGYKLCDRYLHDKDFAKLLGLPVDCILVVNKGEPADPTILAAARDTKAKIISNDRFRDWIDDFPEIATPGLLVRGGYRDGSAWLDDAALQA